MSSSLELRSLNSAGPSRSISPSPRNQAKFLPRTHSTRNISRAKIKTVKLTIVVIAGYILCSAPFVFVQMWATYVKPSTAVRK